MRYATEVYVHKIPTSDLLMNYRTAGRFLEACKSCPDYGKVWSCPPNLPDAYGYLEAYQEVFVIAVKVLYPKEIRALAKTDTDVKLVREQTYEQVKKRLLIGLLALDEECKTGKCLGAGRCILCSHCTRAEGKPCRNPQKRRYSVTGFGFDFAGILQEMFHIPLLWSSEGLPGYDVAVAMFAI